SSDRLLAASEPPEVSETSCPSQYGTHLFQYMNLSGIETLWEPKEYRIDQVRDKAEMARRTWALTDPRPEDELRYLEMLVIQARAFLAECHAFGGRFWESEIFLADYIGNMSEDVSATLLDFVTPGMRALTKQPYLRFAICAPAVCDADALLRHIVPRFMGYHLAGGDLAGADFYMPELSPAHANAQELIDWSSLDLDFVIAGVQMCGTASLWQNLERHPEIGFTHGLEDDTDYFFALGVQRRLSPLKSAIDKFNGRWTAGGRRRPVIGGLRHVKILDYALSRTLAAQVPRLVPIVILCDPVGRAEKKFLTMCAWNQLGMGVRTNKECRDSFEDFFALPPVRGQFDEEAMDQYWRGLLVKDHLLEMHRLFGPRLVIFHQGRFREDERGIYDFVAKAVGATRPFPKDMQFGRYNSVSGQRSDLCLNKTLLQHLKNRLEYEFRAQEQVLALAGQTPPTSLVRRLGRCDRARDSQGSVRVCSQFDRCNFSEEEFVQL
ncbi:unnamed protein product, partial [Polarella glacialis]